jgi:hypothetical protein
VAKRLEEKWVVREEERQVQRVRLTTFILALPS